METAFFIILTAGAIAGLVVGGQLRFVDFGAFSTLVAGALGGGAGLAVASRIATNAIEVAPVVPGGPTEAVVSAIVSGGIGGAALVVLLGVLRALLAEN